MKLGKSTRKWRWGELSLAFVAIMAALSASAAGLSSLTVGPQHFDTHATPIGRAVDDQGFVPVTFAGDWFESGACELYVDGVLVGTSSGALQTNLLAGVEGTWCTRRVTLKSLDGEQTKLITIFPYQGYRCVEHNMSVGADFLDARPAGTVRKVKIDKPLPVAWSGNWTNGADRAVVRVYAGIGTEGALVGELVNSEGTEEGVYSLTPGLARMKTGKYTLTHYDGVDTLNAYLDVRGGGTCFILR
jgi:hypothetical protein